MATYVRLWAVIGAMLPAISILAWGTASATNIELALGALAAGAVAFVPLGDRRMGVLVLGMLLGGVAIRIDYRILALLSSWTWALVVVHRADQLPGPRASLQLAGAFSALNGAALLMVFILHVVEFGLNEDAYQVVGLSAVLLLCAGFAVLVYARKLT